MSYPWSFTTTADVEIDADDILDYVKENREWFLEQLNGQIPERTAIKESVVQLENILNNFDSIRRCRDKAANNRDLVAVKLYEALEGIKSYLEGQM